MSCINKIVLFTLYEPARIKLPKHQKRSTVSRLTLCQSSTYEHTVCTYSYQPKIQRVSQSCSIYGCAYYCICTSITKCVYMRTRVPTWRCRSFAWVSSDCSRAVASVACANSDPRLAVTSCSLANNSPHFFDFDSRTNSFYK